MQIPDTRFRAHLVVIVTLIVALACVPGRAARADEGRVDRQTRAALKLDVHRDRGAATFRQVCARCHGAEAQGDADKAIPALAGQRFAYLVRQLANFSGDERESQEMHRIVSRPELHDPQVWVDVAGYLNSQPVAQTEATGDGAHLALGGAIFHEQCASCHRADARGDDAGFVPSLRNQHYSYLVSQMHKLGEGARHNADEDFVRFIRSLEEPDIVAVADYLSRLHGNGATRKHMRDDGTVVD